MEIRTSRVWILVFIPIKTHVSFLQQLQDLMMRRACYYWFEMNYNVHNKSKLVSVTNKWGISLRGSGENFADIDNRHWVTVKLLVLWFNLDECIRFVYIIVHLTIDLEAWKWFLYSFLNFKFVSFCQYWDCFGQVANWVKIMFAWQALLFSALGNLVNFIKFTKDGTWINFVEGGEEEFILVLKSFTSFTCF